jgi:hypothetical protein
MLLWYFDWSISMGRPLSAWVLAIAAVLAPLLSLVLKVTPPGGRRTHNSTSSVLTFRI